MLADQCQFRVCVPASDVVAGRLGDEVKDILALRNGTHGQRYFPLTSLTRISVPVVLVITKFDVVVSQALFDGFSGAPQQLNCAQDSAHRMYEESCRRVFEKEPREVPAEIVSGIHSFVTVLLEGSTDILDYSQ